ncbi:MAG: hypothetical protein A2X34_08890 [Elusimicrobia bacterium GWC2_51_8]|nr:MAG: hypothetical protein A2X33_02750 [Elusimicrobia bacterium GWA2_51_34]OGR57927.1 MAG: hypothetical protein A2X34_08890 [Elusimicrobia bacterium GWC2_51_8]HAF95548.1 hypothetical protein [Elusimicrobiota bacterium]HCE97708.1 hypothetical protein [Elusimicrobiota bacterium]
MNINDKIRFMENNLARQLDWIRAADSKIAPVIFITTSMLGASVAFLSKTSDPSGFTLALAAICIGALIYTLSCMVMVNFPRITRYDESAIFFEGIKFSGFAGFEKKAGEITEEAYFRDLTRMCYNNAIIASAKFSYVKRAMISLFIAILPWMLLVYNVFHYVKIDAFLQGK